MKKILLSAAAVILILLIGSLGYLYFSLNSLVKKAVETVGPTITKTDVRLASANLLPFSGSGKLSSFVIGNPEGFGKSYALKIESISINVDRNTLLSDTIVINVISISRAEIALEGSLRGNNLSKLMHNIKSSGSGSKSTTEKGSGKSASQKFIVKKVLVTGTQLHVAASALNQSVSQTISLGDIHLENLGSDGSGVSATDVSQQILVPLIDSAINGGLNVLAKQGLKQLEQQGVGGVQKALQGLFK